MNPDLRIESLLTRIIEVPLPRPLISASGTLDTAPMVLLDLHAVGGTGIAYLFCPNRHVLRALAVLLEDLGVLLRGRPAYPLDIQRYLESVFFLLGGTGLVTMAKGAIDMAAWDLLGKAAGLPLSRLLGGSPRAIRAYNSCGLGLIGPQAAAAEAHLLIEGGFKAVKLRLGYPTLAEDLATVRAVQDVLGESCAILVDYNQCLKAEEAMRRCQALDELGLYWIEEPVVANDLISAARLAACCMTPIQLGENFWSPADAGRAIAAGACDLIMPDVLKIGGISAWLGTAAIAAGSHMPVSSHLFPEINQHLLAATPNAHLLEYVDWAAPILREPIRVIDGEVLPCEQPGHGMQWNEANISALQCETR